LKWVFWRYNFNMLLAIVLVAAIVGSFLTVATEDENGVEWLKRKRSQCPNCLRPLGVVDLIPVFSFLIQGGKCRYCRKNIPIRHLIIELSTIVIFVVTFLVIQDRPIQEIILILGVMTFLFAITITDLRFQTLPDSFLFILAILGIVKIYILGAPTLIEGILGLALGAVIFGLIVVLSKGKAMGLGDVKLSSVMGILFGWKVLIVVLFFSFVAGGLLGLLLMLLKKVTPKSQIPFGPFLAGSTALFLLFPDLFKTFLLLLGLR